MSSRIIDSFSGQGTTTNASTATIATYGLPENCSGCVRAQIASVVGGTSPVGMYEVSATFHRGTGNVTIDATGISLSLLPVIAASVYFDASGADLVLKATGGLLSGTVEWVADNRVVIYTQ
jgi:hypothetical protein